MHDFLPGRRSVLKGLTGAAAGLALAPRAVRAATATRHVTFTLPWLPEGSNLFAYVAKANGYWAEAGLDVEISRGYGSVAAAQAIGQGRFDFGLAAASAGIQQTAKGLPIAQILTCGYDSTMGVCVLADSPVKTLKDLAGRRLAATTTSGEYPFLGAFAQKGGLDLSTVEVVQVDAAVRQRVLVEKQVDAICGFAGTFLPVFVANGVQTRFMLYSGQGLTFYNNALMTQPQRLESDPELCRAMADGLARAMRFVLLQPDEALDIFFKQVPEMALAAGGRTQVKVGLGIFRLSLISDILRTKPIGTALPADYERMTDLVMEHLAAPGDARPAVEAVVTNRFVGPVALTPAEFDAAAASAREYAAYLA